MFKLISNFNFVHFLSSAIIIVPAAFQFLTLPLCPESPKYTLIIQGKDVLAQKSLSWLRGTIEIHEELDILR